MIAQLIFVMALSAPASANEGAALCARLQDLDYMPPPGYSADNGLYREFIDAGSSIIPCLIDRISDESLMPDPRQIPGPPKTHVGDIAAFMLVRISGIEFTAMLPPDIRAAYETQGVYAYVDYVNQPGKRTELQQWWRSWFETTHGEETPHDRAPKSR